MVEACSSIGLVTALYVENNISVCLSHLVEEGTLSIDALSSLLSLHKSFSHKVTDLRSSF